MSPRQVFQAVFLLGVAAICIDRLVAGKEVALDVLGLLILVGLVIRIARFYAQGGKPLDRGGTPFWRHADGVDQASELPDKAPVADWVRARRSK